MLIDSTLSRNPKACLSPGLIIDFLRASRKASDDNLRNRLGQVDCVHALTELYREWQVRDSVLQFCSEVRESLERKEAENIELPKESRKISWLTEHARDHIEFPRTPTDPRIDAYSSRNESDHLSSSSMSDWIRSENLTESIVRGSSMKIIKDRCGLNVPEYKPNAAQK